MIKYEKLTLSHFKRLTPTEQQRREANLITEEEAKAIITCSHQYAGVDEDGEVFIICGIHEKWAGTGHLWSIMSNKSGKHLRSMTKLLKRVIADTTYPRIEAMVVADYDKGVRWMEFIGFERGEVIRKYDTFSQDCYLFSLIR